MAEPTLSRTTAATILEDDLPRTLRRERENQARRTNNAAQPENGTPSASRLTLEPPGPEPIVSITSMGRRAQSGKDTVVAGSTVTRLEIPFLHLTAFFLKAVMAAIPALILLLMLLWLAGEALTASFPNLVKMQILIRMPN